MRELKIEGMTEDHLRATQMSVMVVWALGGFLVGFLPLALAAYYSGGFLTRVVEELIFGSSFFK